MRQSIGSTWILGLVIGFMLIFVSFLSLSLNYSKVFRIKNEALSMIEKYEGVKEGETGAVALINNYLVQNNYTTMHYCDVGEYGSKNLAVASLELVSDTRTLYYYCIAKVSTKIDGNRLPNRSKYQVKFFFKFNLPIIGNLLTYRATGETIDINNPTDQLQQKIQ